MVASLSEARVREIAALNGVKHANLTLRYWLLLLDVQRKAVGARSTSVRVWPGLGQGVGPAPCRDARISENLNTHSVCEQFKPARHKMQYLAEIRNADVIDASQAS